MKSKLARKLDAYRDLTITILSYSRWVTRKIYWTNANRRGGFVPFEVVKAQSPSKLAWFFSRHTAHRLVHSTGESHFSLFSGLQNRDRLGAAPFETKSANHKLAPAQITRGIQSRSRSTTSSRAHLGFPSISS
jgi:hypothetical protein